MDWDDNKMEEGKIGSYSSSALYDVCDPHEEDNGGELMSRD